MLGHPRSPKIVEECRRDLLLDDAERPLLRRGSSTHICKKSRCHRRNALDLSLKVDKVLVFDHSSFLTNVVAALRGTRDPGAHPALRNSVSNNCAASCLDFSKCGYTTLA